MKVQTVNEVNKVPVLLLPPLDLYGCLFILDLFDYTCFIFQGFVIEALRSIAELITWGDQHDAAYFECELVAFAV